MNSSKQKGYTLIETVVALAILMAAVVGPVALVTRGIFSSAHSKSSLIAYDLAQEGIELVRAYRDNNVMCDITNDAANWPWDDQANSSILVPRPLLRGWYAVSEDLFDTINQANCNTTTNIRTPRLTFVGINPLACRESTPTRACTFGISSASNFYRSTGATCGNADQFCRAVYVWYNNGAILNDPDPAVPNQDQMVVISVVYWKERGQTNTIQLTERLFRWK